MSIRIVSIMALIALLVVATNGYLNSWFGMSNFGGSKASVGLSGSSVDIRAVQGWASATVAAKVCGMATTDAASALQRSDWDDDALARRTVAKVRKSPKAVGKDAFCRNVWEAYGPSGSELAGLVEQES